MLLILSYPCSKQRLTCYPAVGAVDCSKVTVSRIVFFAIDILMQTAVGNLRVRGNVIKTTVLVMTIEASCSISSDVQGLCRLEIFRPTLALPLLLWVKAIVARRGVRMENLTFKMMTVRTMRKTGKRSKDNLASSDRDVSGPFQGLW